MRTIRYSEAWERCVEEMGEQLARLDDLLQGVEWAVAESPEHFPLVEGTELRIILTDEFPDVPAFVIYFRIVSDTLCCMEWIEHDPATESYDDENPES